MKDPLPNRDPTPAVIVCACGFVGLSDSLHCFRCDAVLATYCPRCQRKTEIRACPNCERPKRGPAVSLLKPGDGP